MTQMERCLAHLHLWGLRSKEHQGHLLHSPPGHLIPAIWHSNLSSQQAFLPVKMMCQAIRCLRKTIARVTTRFSLMFGLHFKAIRTQTRLNFAYLSFALLVRLDRVDLRATENWEDADEKSLFTVDYCIVVVLFATLFAFHFHCIYVDMLYLYIVIIRLCTFNCQCLWKMCVYESKGNRRNIKNTPIFDLLGRHPSYPLLLLPRLWAPVKNGPYPSSSSSKWLWPSFICKSTTTDGKADKGSTPDRCRTRSHARGSTFQVCEGRADATTGGSRRLSQRTQRCNSEGQETPLPSPSWTCVLGKPMECPLPFGGCEDQWRYVELLIHLMLFYWYHSWIIASDLPKGQKKSRAEVLEIARASYDDFKNLPAEERTKAMVQYEEFRTLSTRGIRREAKSRSQEVDQVSRRVTKDVSLHSLSTVFFSH